MSASIQSTGVQPSVLAVLNSSATIGQKDFFKKFGWEKAKMIGTDEDAFVDASTELDSITSFDIGDCITIFAIEKENKQNKTILAWHIGNGSSTKDLVKEFKGYDYTNPYDIYIIGGNESTTSGEKCLLQNIRDAITKTFNSDSKIKFELINPGARTKLNFVSANLHLDGTLTFCHHNIRHL